jgi:CRP/FNR family transcriptional regulator
LGGDDLRAIAALTTSRLLAKGDHVFLEGNSVQGFFVVRAGAIKLYRGNSLGREQVLQMARPTESFAEESLVSEQGYPACACAIEPSEVLLVRKAGFLLLLRRRPELVLCMLRSLGRQVNHLISLLDDLTLKDVKTRLIQWLLAHCADPRSLEPLEIELPMPKRVLAAELGTSSETLSRTFASLRERALVRVDGKTIVLCCPAKLAAGLQPTPQTGRGPGVPERRLRAWFTHAPQWARRVFLPIDLTAQRTGRAV